MEALLSEPGPIVLLGDLVSAFGADGHCALILLLSIPFAIPLLPGMSSPVGFAILFIGLAYARARPPKLPSRLARRSLPREGVKKIVSKCREWHVRVGRFLRPRGDFIQKKMGRVVVGSLFALLGAELALPLPIPGTNTLPALGLIALTLGALERDGVWIALGVGLSAIATAYLAILMIAPTLFFR